MAEATAATAAVARVVPVAEGGHVGMVTWSGDGEWLYAATHEGVSYVAVPRKAQQSAAEHEMQMTIQ